jgi:hypothetical protein
MPGILVTASLVRITPWMIHGWRPTSVTVQPASKAINRRWRGYNKQLSKTTIYLAIPSFSKGR